MKINNLVRIRDESIGTLFCRSIYGLNIFSANKIDLPFEKDPNILFLKSLATAYKCAAFAGSLAMLDVSDETWQPIQDPKMINVEGVRFGLYGGDHFGYENEDRQDGYLYADAEELFQLENLPAVEYLIRCDSLMLCVGTDDVKRDRLKQYLNMDTPAMSAWLECLTDIFSMVVFSTGDGWYMEAYAKDTKHFNGLSDALEISTKMIEETDWYRKNNERLAWCEKETCLMLP